MFSNARARTITILAVIFLVVFVSGVICFWFWYTAHERHMAYLEQIQCSKMAAAYWTNEEVKNDPNYSPLMDNYTSHFNNKLNTCLISEAFNSLSNYTPEKPGKPYSSITTAEEVIDVVSGKTLVQSMYTTSNYARPWPKNAPNGVSTTTMSSTSDYEFQKEAQALMSQ